jgi:hypothetical protein
MNAEWGKSTVPAKKNQENIGSLVPAEVLEVELYILKFSVRNSS